MRAAIFRFRIKDGTTLRVAVDPEAIVIHEQLDTGPIITINGAWYLNQLTGQPAIMDMTFDEAVIERDAAANEDETCRMLRNATESVRHVTSSIMDLPEDE